MKKFCLVFFLLCLSNKANAFAEGTTFWYKHASHADLVRHYKNLELDEVCAMWKEVGYWKKKRRVPNRKAIKAALKSNGEDPFICMKLQNL
ncbi:hypothetical protein OAC19_01670 [Candidatus Pelagibacter sp.]|nr:hypothetical protein [Candidatus Pelagibacter sp.]